MEPAPDYPAASSSRASQPPLALDKPGKAGSGDNFAVDDLLDFSNEDDDGSLGGDDFGAWSSLDAASGNSAEDSSTATTTDNNKASNCCGAAGLDSGDLSVVSSGDQFLGDNAFSGGDLCVPYEDLADLEWLSNLEEEPFSTEDIQKLQLISGSGPLKSAAASSSDAHSDMSTNTAASTGVAGSTSAKPLAATTTTTTTTMAAVAHDGPQLPPLFLPEAPVRGARSKRSRAAAPGNWSSRRLLLLTPTSASQAPAPASSSESELLFVAPSSHHSESPPFSPPPAKKAAKKKDPSRGGAHSNDAVLALSPAPDGRKCLHCQTDKTPQWRTGPMGPKTLCNACGVRYKSGRLVPEYRPAASPTFVQSKHSNSHRKVMELRRQKEMTHHQQLIQQQPSHHQQQQHHHHHHLQSSYYEHRLHGGTSTYLPHPNAFYDGDDFLIHRHVGPDFRQLI